MSYARLRMLSPELRNVVGRYRSRLSSELRSKLVRVVVFGSAARGQAHEDSDVDVLVLLDAPDRLERRRALDLAGEIALETGVPLAPVVQSLDQWNELLARERRFPLEVERDGVEA